jgi:CubicO group peptidase (beta-lactamase class C family)
MKTTSWLAALALSGAVVVAEQRSVMRLDGTRIAVAEIDAAVTRLMRAAEVTGVGLAVFNGRRPVYVKAYGVRDKEKNLPLTENSVMTAASLTKSTFAYVVMQLVDEGIINLDTPVQGYLPRPLPEYPGYEGLARDVRYKRITPRMLLDHSSGFANLRALEPDRTLSLHFDPGSRYAYSGEGIQLLQLTVEAATKRSVEDLMRERIFQPFGMTRTSMVWQDRFETDYANGYDEYGRSLGPERRQSASAAGSMQTTLGDFSRFMQAVAQGQRLRARTRALMTTPQIRIVSKHQFPTLRLEPTEQNAAIHLSYGLGWGLYSTTYGTAFFKEGHDDGWRNYTVFFTKPGIGIVILTNSANGEGIFKELLETSLRNTFTPIEWEGFTPYNLLPPRPPLPQHHVVAVDTARLDSYVGRYRFSPDVMVTVRRQGDHLSVQENDETVQEIFPESQRDFFSMVADDVWTFESGRAVLHTGGKDFTGTRVE